MAESAAYTRRTHKGGASPSELSAGISAGDLTINGSDLSTWAGLVANGPARVMINRGGSTAEEIEVSAIAGNQLTVPAGGRGVGGTTAASHASGETIEVVSSPRDFDEANYTTAETVGKASAANQLLVSDAANSFSALTVAASRILGRKASGDVAALTAAEVLVILGLSSEVTQVKHSTTQALADATETAIVFDTEDFDTATQHDTGSNTDRITIATTGTYEISGSLAFEANATGRRTVAIKQGTTYLYEASDDADAGSDTVLQIPTFTVSLTAADIIRMYGTQNSSGALNVQGEGQRKRGTFLRVKRIS